MNIEVDILVLGILQGHFILEKEDETIRAWLKKRNDVKGLRVLSLVRRRIPSIGVRVINVRARINMAFIRLRPIQTCRKIPIIHLNVVRNWDMSMRMAKTNWVVLRDIKADKRTKSGIADI